MNVFGTNIIKFMQGLKRKGNFTLENFFSRPIYHSCLMTLRFSHGESAVNLRIVEPSDQMHNFHTPVVYLDTQKSHRCVFTNISSNTGVRTKEEKICPN